MKRIGLAFCVFAVLALAGAGSASATNILGNPGFETGSLGPWTVGSNLCTGSFCSPWTVSTAAAESGTYSAVDLGNIELTQTFAAVATSSITDASFWVMHSLARTGGSVPMMVVFGYSNGTTSSVTIDTLNTSWDQEDVTADLASGLMLDSISVFGYAPNLNEIAGGTAGSAFTYVDDFDIEVAGSTATPEPGALVLLGSGLIGTAGMFRRFRKAE